MSVELKFKDRECADLSSAQPRLQVCTAVLDNIVLDRCINRIFAFLALCQKPCIVSKVLHCAHEVNQSFSLYSVPCLTSFTAFYSQGGEEKALFLPSQAIQPCSYQWCSHFLYFGL